MDVLAFRPTEFLKSVLQSFDAGFCFWIDFTDPHQHTDTGDSAGLLRLRSNLPRQHHAAEEGYELSPSHNFSAACDLQNPNQPYVSTGFLPRKRTLRCAASSDATGQ